MLRLLSGIPPAVNLSLPGRAALLLFLTHLMCGVASSQDYGSTDGTTPSGLKPGTPAGSYALSGFDNVNLFNGNLNVHLPLISIGGRGKAGYTMMLAIDSKQWLVHQNSSVSSFWADYNSWTGFKPELTPGVMNPRSVGSFPVDCSEFGLPVWYTHTLTRLTFTAADGTEYEFHDALKNGAVIVSVCNNLAPLRRGTVWVTGDGSGATFISDFELYDNPYFVGQNSGPLQANGSFAPMSGYLLLRNGTRYRLDNNKVSWIRDANGNRITLTPTVITDSLNRTVNLATDANANTTITFSGFGGTNRQIKIWRASLSQLLRSDFPLPVKKYSQLFTSLNGSLNTPFDPTLVSAVELPNGRKYEFRYNYYGELAKVILPTGGSYEYDWEPGPGADPDGVVWYTLGNINGYDNYVNVYHRVKEKRVYSSPSTLEGKTIFTAAHPGYFDPRLWTTSVKVVQKSPGNAFVSGSRHYFNGSPTGSFVSFPFDYSEWDDAREYRTEALADDAATPSVFRNSAQSWENPSGAPTILNWHSFTRREPPNNPRDRESVTSILDTGTNGAGGANPAKVSKVHFDYDQYNNRTDVYEYHFGSDAPGLLLRRTHSQYLGSASYTGTGVHLRSLPTQQWVSSDAAGSNKLSLTDYEYDNYTPEQTQPKHAALIARLGIAGLCTRFDSSGNCLTSDDPTTYTTRGNVTKVSSWLSTGGTVDSYSQYDVAGNVVKSIDPRSKTVTIDYSSSFQYSLPTMTTSPVPDPAGVTGSSAALVASIDYDFSTGHVVSATDANGKVTIAAYNDLLDRLTTVTRPAGGGATSYQYGDAPGNLFLHTQTSLDASRDLHSYQYFDGLGRTTRSYGDYDGTNYSVVDTQYDALGRVYRVSNPYNATTLNGTVNPSGLWTTTDYDALSRVISVTTPDSAVVSTAYLGATATGTDQQGHKQKSQVDVRGRLVEVTEDPDTGGLSYQTTYNYDVLDNLRTVTQGSQTRTFGYDSLKRLTSAANPENGTIRYEYDNNGNVTKRTDSRSPAVVTKYSFDDINRMTSRSYDDIVAVTYKYDAATNGLGRLASVDAIGVSKSSYLTYDANGRITSYSQGTIVGGTTKSYSTSYTYNLAGMTVDETYPSLKVMHTEYDVAGRVAGVKDKNKPATSYYAGAAENDTVNRIQYAAHGEVTALKLGNGKWEHTSFNNRLQPDQIGLGTNPSDSSLLKLDYTFGLWNGVTLDSTKNNGNIQSQSMTVGPTTIKQSYLYDSLNRLQSASEALAGSPKWTQSNTFDRYGNRTGLSNSGLDGFLLPTSSTPSVNPSTNRLNQSGYVYDPAGNLTHEPGKTYDYDAENRLVNFNSGVAEYKYDGDGHRVLKTDRSVTPVLTTVFVYNAQGQLIAEYDTGSSSGVGTRYLTPDHLGSTRVVTSESGGVVSRRDYLPFGEEIPSQVGGRSGVGNYGVAEGVRQRFTQKERDNESGLDYFLARYYSSTQGRFTSVDSGNAGARIGDPQSWNLYVYARNNPLFYVDPTGHDYIVFDKDGNEKRITDNQLGNYELISSVGVSAVFKDKGGTEWSGTFVDVPTGDAFGVDGSSPSMSSPAYLDRARWIAKNIDDAGTVPDETQAPLSRWLFGQRRISIDEIVTTDYTSFWVGECVMSGGGCGFTMGGGTRPPPLGRGRWIPLKGAGNSRADEILKAAKEAVRGTGQKSGESGNPYLVAASQLRQLLKGEGSGWTQGYREEIIRKIQEFTNKGRDVNHPYK